MRTKNQTTDKDSRVTWVKLAAHHHQDCKVYARVEPDKIIQIDRIFEGHSGLGIVSTIDGKSGLIVVHVTPDTKSEAIEVLKQIPWEVEVLPGPPEG